MNKSRNIHYLVVHCTETAVNITAESIRKYRKENYGWDGAPPFHYLIQRDGTVVQLLDENKNTCGHYPHHTESIHIAYLGGIDKQGNTSDNRTILQKHSLFDLLIGLLEKYTEAKALGHRDLPEAKTNCPCFDVKDWLKNYEPDLTIPV